MWKTVILLSTLILFGTGTFRTTRNLAAACQADCVSLRVRLSPIRSANFLTYRTSGMGTVGLENRGDQPLDDLELRVEIPSRGDLLPEPFTLGIISLAPGEVREVVVRPRLAPAILHEPTTEIPFQITLLSRGRQIVSRQFLVGIIERSQVTWDLPERIAALMDPGLFAGMLRSSPVRGGQIPIRNLELAARSFDRLMALQLHYMEDTPSPAAAALLCMPVDRVSLPAETLASRSGDCDDLTVLLASAMESVGIPTAIASVEDHVFPLFDLGIKASEIEAAPVEAEGLLFRGGRVWVPLEATCLTRRGATFLAAWKEGRARLKEIRSGRARFFVVRTAWTDFPAIGAMARGRTIPSSLIRGPVEEAGHPSRSTLELAATLLLEVKSRAERARSGRGVSAAEGRLRAAEVYLAAGYHEDAKGLLRQALTTGPTPGVRLELARAILAHPLCEGEIDEARQALEMSLVELDPLDFEARRTALELLSATHRRQGKYREATEVALLERELLSSFPGVPGG